MAKGKPEQHKTDLTRVQGRELPVISWDFAFTGKSCEGVDESSDQSKLTTLVMHDSHTGAVHCVPVNNKSQTRYMSQEVLRFINFTGHGKVALRCDQEPTMLQIQKLVQRARQRLNLSTVIENAKVGDHGSNAAVEKAIDRVRNQASVYLHALSTNIGFEILPRHPLFAWAFVHSSWTLTRFTVKAGATPYELISGHGYNSTLCPFGCPVMVFVGDSVKQKGDSKWHRGIFLTKSMSNDMFLTAVGGTLKFSRSVKMIFPQWHEHMDQYRQVLTFPWQLEGSVGSRVNPTVRDPDITAFAVPGIDDEAADDPTEDTSVPLMIEDFVPMAGTGRRNTPPPPTAVVSAPADTSETATTATAMQDNAEPVKQLMFQNQIQNDQDSLQCVLEKRHFSMLMWTIQKLCKSLENMVLCFQMKICTIACSVLGTVMRCHENSLKMTCGSLILRWNLHWTVCNWKRSMNMQIP